jgi:hypothetical protein
MAADAESNPTNVAMPFSKIESRKVDAPGTAGAIYTG